ncbi:hypothetical protein Amac_055870 [Acrocarpospora macrocephala]|uniref:Uncharacterized protein n=1 Tax=Acrocarpospora macrocephala TaxID=150177 RepID=A0A5M3WTJ4_9ACTN|nr:hypothetical protein Amac_055870 [Acrocarpospora macrocephala]
MVTGVRVEAVGTERVRVVGFGTSEGTGSWVSGTTSTISSTSRAPRTLESRLGGESGTLNVEMGLDLVSLRGGESGTKKGNPSEGEETGVLPVVEVRRSLTTGGREVLVDLSSVVVRTVEERTNCSLGRVGPSRRGSSGNSSI